MKAKIWCEVACANCGGITYASQEYKNATTISQIKEATKNWIYSHEIGGNLCPSCQEELGIKK